MSAVARQSDMQWQSGAKSPSASYSSSHAHQFGQAPRRDEINIQAAAKPLGGPMGAISDTSDQGLGDHGILPSGNKRFHTLKPLPRDVADLRVLGCELGCED